MHRWTKVTIACLGLSVCLAAQNTPVGYSAEEVNEFSQTLSDGTRIHTETHTKIYQDSKGRLRKDTGDFAVIYDPVADAAYRLDLEKQIAYRLVFSISYDQAANATSVPNREKGVIYIVATQQGRGYRFSSTVSFPPEGPGRLAFTTFNGSSVGLGPNSQGNLEQSMKQEATMHLFDSMQHMATMFRERPQAEPLGTQMFGEFAATGTRNTTTYAAGVIGNDRPFQTVRETWVSSDLGRPVLTKSTDPHYGDSLMRLINISKGDPDISLFQPPPGFRLDAGR